MAMLGGGGNKPAMPNVNHLLCNSHYSLWTSLPHCSHRLYPSLISFKMPSDKLSLRTTSSNGYCDKVKAWEVTLHLNFQALLCHWLDPQYLSNLALYLLNSILICMRE